MSSLKRRLTSSFTKAGIGVHGRAAGIVRAAIIQTGTSIKTSLLFMLKYPLAGGMITEIIVGKDTNGTVSEYLISRFSSIGTAGKEIGIGRSSKRGASRGCMSQQGQGRM